MDGKNQTTNQQGEVVRLLTVIETYTLLRISKWKLYDLMRKKLIESVNIGKRRFIPLDAYASYVERLRQRETFA
ncbi:helix-turn-helix domain-containing protein [Streptomyces sp. AC555_RSS877]|uniref:helix-turn-helix domain-containing protein n=1 Tax=Streptomyces sp. AC555_RSS877 TaxID=2823688 RepID=UPI001C276B72|nr:helix-turn-helix domain-containing protein [Streptomyces sp. AC555_RSS877]